MGALARFDQTQFGKSSCSREFVALGARLEEGTKVITVGALEAVVEAVVDSLDQSADLGRLRCSSQEAEDPALTVVERTRPRKPIEALLERRRSWRRLAGHADRRGATPFNSLDASALGLSPIDLLQYDDAVASVPPGKFGDEKYAYRLIGRVLNAADELPDRAVRSDVFKRMITGEPVPARDVYRSAVDFVPVALHVFSTNVLPSFSGGVDGGTVRRLLPIEFSSRCAGFERDPDLPERILSEEADPFPRFRSGRRRSTRPKS